MLPRFKYVRAGSSREAVNHLAVPGSRVHAGGTDLLGCLRDGVFEAAQVVSISRLEDLRGVGETSDGGLRLGALTTVAETAEHPIVRERYPALGEAAAQVASPQLRNQGTLGGNLCQRPRCAYFRGEFHCAKKGGDACFAVGGENAYHAVFGGGPCWMVHPSDTAPALVSLDATVRILGPSGGRLVPIESFFVLPERDVTRENDLAQGEIVTEILLPPVRHRLKSSYRKIRERGAWDFALTSVATAVHLRDGQVEGAKIVLGGVAPVPWRAKRAEAAIVGMPLSAETAARAAEAAAEGAEPLEQNGYKVPMIRGAVEESLLALA